MQQIIFAMFAAGLFLAVRDMAKVFLGDNERIWVRETPQDRLLRMKAEAFRTLAEEFGADGEESSSGPETMQRRVWDTFQRRACKDCRYRVNCDKVGRIGRKKYAYGMIRLMDDNQWEQYEAGLGDWLSWCSRGRETAQILAYCMQEYYTDQFRQRQLKDIQTATAMQLSEISHMLKQSARETQRYQPLGEGMQKKLKNAAYRRGMIVGDAWTMEKDNRRLCFFMTLRTRNHKTKALQDILDVLENLTGRHLTADSSQKMFVGEEYELYSFTETVRYDLLCGVSRKAKSSETVCGDNYSIFAGDGSVQLCLSDGMGSGIHADRTSERVLNLLEEFMACGFSKETAFQMIHTTLLLQESREIYATLDICQVNLYTGVCEFMKAGACDSFILRHNRVECIALPAMAPGLKAKAGYEKMRLRLRPGDYIIMVTDGVLDTFSREGETDAWQQLLLSLPKKAPKKMSEDILSAVFARQQEKSADDMTVLVAGFWDKQE